MISGFLALKREKDHANGDKETSKVAFRVHREVFHSLDDLPRDFHLNSELQQLSPSSLKIGNMFYRINSLQQFDFQLDSQAPRMEEASLIFIVYKYEGRSLW